MPGESISGSLQVGHPGCLFRSIGSCAFSGRDNRRHLFASIQATGASREIDLGSSPAQFSGFFGLSCYRANISGLPACVCWDFSVGHRNSEWPGLSIFVCTGCGFHPIFSSGCLNGIRLRRGAVEGVGLSARIGPRYAPFADSLTFAFDAWEAQGGVSRSADGEPTKSILISAGADRPVFRKTGFLRVRQCFLFMVNALIYKKY
jgi:hypothetical protein